MMQPRAQMDIGPNAKPDWCASDSGAGNLNNVGSLEDNVLEVDGSSDSTNGALEAGNVFRVQRRFRVGSLLIVVPVRLDRSDNVDSKALETLRGPHDQRRNQDAPIGMRSNSHGTDLVLRAFELSPSFHILITAPLGVVAHCGPSQQLDCINNCSLCWIRQGSSIICRRRQGHYQGWANPL